MDLIAVKKSHIKFYNQFPLYYMSKEGEPVLYKEAGKTLDGEMLDRNQYPEFFISREDEKEIVEKLMTVLNLNLTRSLSKEGVEKVKTVIAQIVNEALENPLDTTLPRLPETIEILFNNAKKNPTLLESLAAINSNSPFIVEHIINVLTLTTHYSFFKNLPEAEIKRLSMCALLHDIGTSHIDRHILETDEKLTEEEFDILKTHSKKGYNDIKVHPSLDKSIAAVALEHHEKLDGSGYPSGLKDICYEAQVIGLIDSYEQLKYREKKFRKALPPFHALQIIKEDVLDGKYSRQIFTDLCSCLTIR